MAIMIQHSDAIDRGETKQPEFEEYPKMMTHPAFEPGKAAEEVKLPGGSIQYVGGTNIRFPPVLVNTRDQQDYYEAQGYVSQGKSDPAAFARAHANAQPAKTGYVPQEYPKWAGGKIVNNKEEEDAALAARRAQLGMTPVADAAFEQAEASIEAGESVAESVKDAEIAALKARIDEMQAMMRELAATVGAAPAAAPKPAKTPPTERGKKAWATRLERQRLAQETQAATDEDEAA